ncbi:hypothetical protein [Caballeronia grimmiae]|uniref:Uncharacterized protein n=1 Tax=Caballeronia grimmiae TaxID=1071679 RepID=A0A069NFX3_9BURK|nr:hypothetical protein [Caballeronia grimmiae]KDR27220.1 hypothetical protein BG57_23455 [Caballeronia grimmiae]
MTPIWQLRAATPVATRLELRRNGDHVVREVRLGRSYVAKRLDRAFDGFDGAAFAGRLLAHLLLACGTEKN